MFKVEQEKIQRKFKQIAWFSQRLFWTHKNKTNELILLVFLILNHQGKRQYICH